MKHHFSFPTGFISIWCELYGRNIHLSHGRSKSSIVPLSCDLCSRSGGWEDATQTTTTTLTSPPQVYAAHLLQRTWNTVMALRSWQSGATEETRSGQSEAMQGNLQFCFRNHSRKFWSNCGCICYSAFSSSPSFEMILYEPNCWWFLRPNISK